MANRKKTEIEESTPTNKKGITKVDTTRTQKIVSQKKSTTKRTSSKTTRKKSTTLSNKNTSTDTKSTTKKSKASAKKETTKKTTAKKTSTAKSTRTKKSANDKITSKTVLVKEFKTSEYYDLPFTYNQTVVKILAQTPEILFVYWDISDEDRKKYTEEYGKNFFNETKPVLIITNKTMGYTFEVDINDFANSWYLHVKDTMCEYHIELGRRPISYHIQIPNDYLYVASSNIIEAPNDRILFDNSQNMVYYKNVKTNEIASKSVTNLSFLSNMGQIYNIYDIYHKIYKDEEFEGNSSSVFK